MSALSLLSTVNRSATLLYDYARELETAMQALANPDGIIRAGDPSAIRIPPHEYAQSVLDRLAERNEP